MEHIDYKTEELKKIIKSNIKNISNSLMRKIYKDLQRLLGEIMQEKIRRAENGIKWNRD